METPTEKLAWEVGTMSSRSFNEIHALNLLGTHHALSSLVILFLEKLQQMVSYSIFTQPSGHRQCHCLYWATVPWGQGAARFF